MHICKNCGITLHTYNFVFVLVFYIVFWAKHRSGSQKSEEYKKKTDTSLFDPFLWQKTATKTFMWDLSLNVIVSNPSNCIKSCWNPLTCVESRCLAHHELLVLDPHGVFHLMLHLLFSRHVLTTECNDVQHRSISCPYVFDISALIVFYNRGVGVLFFWSGYHHWCHHFLTGEGLNPGTPTNALKEGLV